MEMNHLIDYKNHGMKRYLLWQKDHYHYQITTAQGGKGFKLMQDLPDTKCEKAKEIFRAFRP